jgi:hypothetical protein
VSDQAAPTAAPVPAWPAAPGVAPAGQTAYAGVPAVPPQPVRPNRVLAVLLMAVSAAYVVLCLLDIAARSHRISLANQLIADPTMVTMDQATSADDSVNTAGILALVVFIGALVVMGIWQRSLRKAFAPTGQYQTVLKQGGYQIFRIAWLVSLAMAVLLRGTANPDTPQDLISHDHQYMLYYGIRAAFGVLLVVLAARMLLVSQRAAALAQSGYSPEAAQFLQG